MDRELVRRMAETFLTDCGIPEAGRLVTEGLVSAKGKGAVVVQQSSLTHIRDLLAEPDDLVSWIVHGLLPAGGMSVFGGKPKGGKSTTARAIALRVCRGEPVLGRTTTKGPVIYLGLEDPRRVTKGHLRTLGARADDDLYVFTGSRPAEALDWLENVLSQVDPVLVVVDTLQHMLGVSDLNDYARVVAALGPVLALVRSRRAHIMLVHHAGKGDRAGFDTILGSTAIVGTVDVALLLRRRDDNTRTLTTLQRTGEDLPESVLTLDAQQEPQIGGTRAAYDAKQSEEKVVAWLNRQSEPVTRDAVKEAVEGRAEVVLRALQRLVESGEVIRTGEGRRGDPYLFRRSRTYQGTEMQRLESSETSRDAAMLSVPAVPASQAMTFAHIGGSELDRCPRCGGARSHFGIRSDAGWVCPRCYPEAAAAMSAPRVPPPSEPVLDSEAGSAVREAL